MREYWILETKRRQATAWSKHPKPFASKKALGAEARFWRSVGHSVRAFHVLETEIDLGEMEKK